jgi:hypothetical protein
MRNGGEVMNSAVMIVGMICLTVIALSLIGSKFPDDEEK